MRDDIFDIRRTYESGGGGGDDDFSGANRRGRASKKTERFFGKN